MKKIWITMDDESPVQTTVEDFIEENSDAYGDYPDEWDEDMVDFLEAVKKNKTPKDLKSGNAGVSFTLSVKKPAKTASLRSQIIRLAYEVPSLRKHLLPLVTASKRVTVESVTDEQIEALRSEAGSHGDKKMVAICDKALRGNKAAIKQCVEAINDGQG